MITDDEVRELLQKAAPPVAASPERGLADAWAAYQRHRTTTRRQLAVAAVAAAVVAVLVTSLSLASYRSTPAVSHGNDTTAMATWPTRGALADDESLKARAQQAFTDQSTAWGDYQVSRVLYAGGLGRKTETVVALQVSDQADNHSAVAFLMTRYGAGDASTATSTAPLYLRSIVDISADPNPGAVGFVADRLPIDAPATDDASMIGVALLNPRYAGHPTSLNFSLYGDPLTDTPGATSGPNSDGLLQYPAMTGSGPWNTSVLVDGRPITATIGGGRDTPIPETVTVLSQNAAAGRMVVTSTPTIHTGDAVFTTTGLIGTVTGVTGGHATVDTNLTHIGDMTTGSVEIYLSHQAAHIVGTAGAYAVTLDERPDSSAGWRIVLTGGKESQIVINIGNPVVSGLAKPATMQQVPLTLSVNPDSIDPGDTLMYIDLDS